MADGSMDVTALGSFLSDELGVSVTETEVLHDGLNLLVGIETSSGDTYVLRRPNKLRDTGYMNGIETEYAVLRRLHDTVVPTPAPVLFHDGGSVFDDTFFVMSRLDGETVPNGAQLPDRFRNPESRERVATRLVDTLGDIHSLDTEPFAEVCKRWTPLEQVETALERLDAAARVTGREWPRLRRVAERLRRNAPSSPEMRLTHGDFRPSNVLLDGPQIPAVAGVLDWESAMVGDPLTDLGYFLLHWRDDGDPRVDLDEFESTCSAATRRDLKRMNEDGLCPFAVEPGSPDRRELVARYEDRTEFDVRNESFYRAHAAFLLAMVWEDLERDAIEAGADPGPAPFVEYMALLAERVVDDELRS